MGDLRTIRVASMRHSALMTPPKARSFDAQILGLFRPFQRVGSLSVC